MTKQGSDRGEITGHSTAVLRAVLLTSLLFRQGLNWSKIIAVMSKGNLPQTEAGSSEAVAPGKAELLSFLKCQRGTGTGSTSPHCSVISSSSALTCCCPEQDTESRDLFSETHTQFFFILFLKNQISTVSVRFSLFHFTAQTLRISCLSPWCFAFFKNLNPHCNGHVC